MLIFSNQGLIDPTCITTFGVSVKQTDNPIGYFGTGLKYAIACILRNGGEITINSGLDVYEFTTVNKTIRGESFEVICMNGQGVGLNRPNLSLKL